MRQVLLEGFSQAPPFVPENDYASIDHMQSRYDPYISYNVHP